MLAKRIRLAVCALSLTAIAGGFAYTGAAEEDPFCDDHCTRVYLQCIARGLGDAYCQWRYEKCWDDCTG